MSRHLPPGASRTHLCVTDRLEHIIALRSVASDEDTRQETAKERSVDKLHEHLELFLNAVASSAAVPNNLGGYAVESGNGMDIFIATS